MIPTAQSTQQVSSGFVSTWFKKEETVLAQLTQGSPRESEDQWLRSYCIMCMQADGGTLLHIEDGVVTNIVGNPDCPTNKGKICIRSISSIMGLYNPYRVKGPLKRTNPDKGPDVDPGWVEITWEEALNTVAEKFKKIREEDPRKLLVWDGWGCTESLFITMKELERAMNYEIGGKIFAEAFGTPNAEGSHGPTCSIHYAANEGQGALQEACATGRGVSVQNLDVGEPGSVVDGRARIPTRYRACVCCGRP